LLNSFISISNENINQYGDIMPLTKILDKLVQIGPGYLDQTLRTYIVENREYKFYTDTANAKSYAVISYPTTGALILQKTSNTDILIVAGGGGSSIGNISGGSGGGAVINIEKAQLPEGHYICTVGAGGTGGVQQSGFDSLASPLSGHLGNPGSPSSFGPYLGSTTGTWGASSPWNNPTHPYPVVPVVVAEGGGVGGYRGTDTLAVPGGCGGGAGGADRNKSDQSLAGHPASFGSGAAKVDNADWTTLNTQSTGTYMGGAMLLNNNDGGNSNPWDEDPSYTQTPTTETYFSGGGGGAGTTGGVGTEKKAGDGGDGITVPWVNEVFQNLYRYNGDIYWGGGGGGAATGDEEPGDGGLGGGGGGASYRAAAGFDTLNKRYFNGKGGKNGYAFGYSADRLFGGAGGVNTGGGAGGSLRVDATVGAWAQSLFNIANYPVPQGYNGGSGFILIRIELDEAFGPFSASLVDPATQFGIV
jgi:hypothetical protein